MVAVAAAAAAAAAAAILILILGLVDLARPAECFQNVFRRNVSECFENDFRMLLKCFQNIFTRKHMMRSRYGGWALGPQTRPVCTHGLHADMCCTTNIRMYAGLGAPHSTMATMRARAGNMAVGSPLAPPPWARHVQLHHVHA